VTIPATDTRVVPSRPGRGVLREKGSRFLAFASPIESADSAAEEIRRLRREYHDATHVAFAWKIGSGDAARARSSDDGEPSGTAGKPIALAIEAAGLTDVLVAVVRTFGGIKLGTAGLARAYREAAARALSEAGSRLLRETVRILVTCRYESAGAVRRLLRPPEVSLLEERFGAECLFRILVQPSRLANLTRALEAAQLTYEVESVEGAPKAR
jgi:uncharacterized YigZ family protein